MNCPKCATTDTRERAKKTKCGYAIFFCPKCHRVFNERTGTPFNHLEFPTAIVLLAVLWRLRYKLSLRDVAEMFLTRGLRVHARSHPRLGSAVCAFDKGPVARQAAGGGWEILACLTEPFVTPGFPALQAKGEARQRRRLIPSLCCFLPTLVPGGGSQFRWRWPDQYPVPDTFFLPGR